MCCIIVYHSVNSDGTSSTRNSVIISTFPDPQDDQVLRGSHSKAWRKAQQAPTRVDDRSSDAASNLNNNKDTAEDRNRNRSSGKVVGGETIVPPSIREVGGGRNRIRSSSSGSSSGSGNGNGSGSGRGKSKK